MYNSMALIVFTLLCAHQQTPSTSSIFFVLENGQELQNKKMQMSKKKKKSSCLAEMPKRRVVFFLTKKICTFIFKLKKENQSALPASPHPLTFKDETLDVGKHLNFLKL